MGFFLPRHLYFILVRENTKEDIQPGNHSVPIPWPCCTDLRSDGTTSIPDLVWCAQSRGGTLHLLLWCSKQAVLELASFPTSPALWRDIQTNPCFKYFCLPVSLHCHNTSQMSVFVITAEYWVSRIHPLQSDHFLTKEGSNCPCWRCQKSSGFRILFKKGWRICHKLPF